MSKKIKAIEKENLQVVDGKVVITSEEVANLIQNEAIELTLDEEAGWNLCYVNEC